MRLQNINCYVFKLGIVNQYVEACGKPSEKSVHKKLQFHA